MDSVTLQPCMLMIAIVERGKGAKLAGLLSGEQIFFSIALVGRGTARRKAHTYLGMGESAKDVMACVAPAQALETAIEKITKALELSRQGKGIVFTIPLSRLGRRPVFCGQPQAQQRKGGLRMDAAVSNLVMIILNHGYADDVMDTALEAGAPGGTVLRGRGAGFKQAEKFLGITIHPDKDILMILAEKEVCISIMDRVIDTHGKGKPAHAVAFSLPVSHISGLSTGVSEGGA